MTTTIVGPDAPVDVPPQWPEGQQLVETRSLLDGGEGRWLAELAEFDVAGGWVDDGQLSCVTWLGHYARMARSTAFEKLRVGHAIRSRPVLAEAVEEGGLSYCALRSLSRVDNPDPETDRAFVELARSSPVRHVDAAVAYYRQQLEQERQPKGLPLEHLFRRGLRTRSAAPGWVRAELTMTEADFAELTRCIDRVIDAQYARQSARADSSTGSGPGGAGAGGGGGGGAGAREGGGAGAQVVVEDGGESARADSSTGFGPWGPWEEPMRSWAERRLDALLDLARESLGQRDDAHAPGADRYLLHVLTDADALNGDPSGVTRLLDGGVVMPEELERIRCDCTTVLHLLGRRGEPLALGRSTRSWSRAQRRAITVRDGGHCRFPGCDNTICDIHHLRFWRDGGPSDVTNGALVCTAHHSALHRDFTADGDANETVVFRRDDGSVIGFSPPARHLWASRRWRARRSAFRP